MTELELEIRAEAVKSLCLKLESVKARISKEKEVTAKDRSEIRKATTTYQSIGGASRQTTDSIKQLTELLDERAEYKVIAEQISKVVAAIQTAKTALDGVEFERVMPIPVIEIRAGSNDRKDFDENALKELGESIRSNGLAQPITVRPIVPPNGHKYEIVAGERRYRAVSLLGWSTIPAIVRDLGDEQAAEIMLVENTSRADLNPIEEGSAYKSRVDKYGWDVRRIAKVAGVSTERVKRRMGLLDLVPEIQTLVAHGNLNLSHAESMTGLDADRQRVAVKILQSGKTVSLSAFRQVVGDLLAAQSQDALFDLGEFWKEKLQETAQQAKPKRGVNAVTHAPVRNDVPLPAISFGDDAATAIERYIADLIADGKEKDAATIGVLYDALVAAELMDLPEKSMLEPNSEQGDPNHE